MLVKSVVKGMALALILTTALLPELALALSDTSEALDEALRLKPRIDHGGELFQTCAACHGNDGWGASDGSVPAIAGQSAPVLVKQLVEFRYDARHSIRMQHFTDRHHLTRPQDLADVAAYVQDLPPREPVPGGQDARIRQGASLFAASCASCHGARAQGSAAKRIPRLAAQHFQYLQEQLHDAAEGRRPSMERDHARLLVSLSREDIDAIAEYLASVVATPLGAERDRDPAPIVPAAASVESQPAFAMGAGDSSGDHSTKRTFP